MRGVAFIGGEGPNPARLGELIGNPDIIVAADSGLSAAERAGYRPHWIVGDMDSLEEPELLEGYEKSQILSYPEDKDDTDTEIALELLFSKGCTHTCLVGGGGGRIDHTLALVALFERHRSPDRWLTAMEDLRLLDAHKIASLQLSLPRESMVSLFPLGLGPWKIRSTGLKWPLDELPWKRGFFGISNRTTLDILELWPDIGTFLVVLPQFPVAVIAANS